MTKRPFLLFIDADVRLAPDAAARLVPAAGVDLVSGVPHQRMEGVIEMAVIPMINTLIYGYLPLAFMRLSNHPAFTAACGQMLMVRASAYRESGGHAAIAGFMHDAMQLAKLFRRKGLRTDLVDGTRLAECRMYDNPTAVIEGFAKNATEGMARPVAFAGLDRPARRRPSVVARRDFGDFVDRDLCDAAGRLRRRRDGLPCARQNAPGDQMPRFRGDRPAPSPRDFADTGDPVARAVPRVARRPRRMARQDLCAQILTPRSRP